MCRKHFVFMALLSLVLLSAGKTAYAQPDVVLVSDPDSKTIFIGSDSGNREIKAWVEGGTFRFSWQIQGPGTLSGNTKSAEISYIPPDSISEETAQAVITAVVTDDKGESTKASLSFTLLGPPPTGRLRIFSDVPDTLIYVSDKMEGRAHPGKPLELDSVHTGHLIIRAEAEGHAVKSEVVALEADQTSEIVFELVTPEQRLERTLKKGDARFAERHFTEPKGESALDAYRSALRTHPGNRHAKKKILEMINICMSLGDTAYEEGQYKKAPIFYQECLPIMRYAMDSLGEKGLSAEYQKAEERLAALKKGRPPRVAKKKEAPQNRPETPEKKDEAASPPASSEEEIEPPETEEDTEQLLSRADAFFEEKHFTMPKRGNAFDLYKKVLESEPENAHARAKISEMAEIYKAWGKGAEKQEDYKKARIFYQRYLTIAAHMTKALGDKRVEADMQNVRKNLKKIKKTSRQLAGFLKRGDDLFKKGRFVSPKGDNAFEMYKKVLKSDTGNNYARKKIFEMMKVSEERGDRAYQREDYKKAKRFYQSYLDIAGYISGIAGTRRMSGEIWKIQNRLQEVEHNLAVREKLGPLEERLSQEFGKYRKLREEEMKGNLVSDRLIPLLGEMVANLKAIEALYTPFSQVNAVMSEKLKRVASTRQELEKEIAFRTSE